MRIIIPLLTIILIISLASGCSRINCEEYTYEDCPKEKCSVCAKNVWYSNLECYSKDYCEMTNKCIQYSLDDCPKQCTICPPCEACSSISCQSVQFCEGIGFDKNWYESLRNK